MAAGEPFLAALIQSVLERLASTELLGFVGIEEKLETWRGTLQTYQSVLNDAEEKQLTNDFVKMWLDDLKDVIYDLEDMLDDLATETLRSKFMADPQASACEVPIQLSTHSISLMGTISAQLEHMSKCITELGLEKIAVGMPCEARNKSCLRRCSGTEFGVYGRNEHKKQVLEMLLRADQSGYGNLGIVAIVGEAGIGKTTLAHLVYNEEAVKDFELKVWLCASGHGFDALANSAYEEIIGRFLDLKELHRLSIELRDWLHGQKFLIVLDNVSCKDYDNWEALKFAFSGGAPGSRILATTLDIEIAEKMGATEAVVLDPLSEDDCWSIVMERGYLETELFREEIVRKCNGLPLAAHVLSGLFCSREKIQRENILNSKEWSMLPDQNDILSVLKLCYHHLSSYLKRCFVYCLIFPRDHEFEEEELVLLWMAEGLLSSQQTNRHLKEFGHHYFQELVCRSFIQRSRGDPSKFSIHDLFRDLAQYVAGDMFLIEPNALPSKKVRHLSYTRSVCDGYKRLENFCKFERLRTFLPLRKPLAYDGPDFSYLSVQVLESFPKLKYLRTLSLCGYRIPYLPESIGDLKHLRYFNLSSTTIRTLPSSTCMLLNLQTLVLRNCHYLKELPTDFHNLVNLSCLDISDVNLLKGMPTGMKDLKNLCFVPDFVVEESNGAGIGELMELNLLQGSLCIKRLENLKNAKETWKSSLHEKNLDMLWLKWTPSAHNLQDETVDCEVIEKLQPPPKIKELQIECYGGNRFPAWLQDPVFPNMVRLRLQNCKKCTSLPPLGHLPSLKELVFKGLSAVESIGHELYGSPISMPFPSLETLHFENMTGLKNWRFPRKFGALQFPQLQKLSLYNCPMLCGTLPSHLPSLKELVIHLCSELAVSIPSLPLLRELKVDGCKEIVQTSTINFSSLKYMQFSQISKFTSLTKGFLNGLTRVGTLEISDCKDLTCIWRQCLIRNVSVSHSPMWISWITQDESSKRQMREVERLKLHDADNVEKLPEFLYGFPSLKELYITAYPGRVLLRESGLPSSLRKLLVKDSFDLQCLLDEEYPNTNINYRCLLT